jgi:hypothetical protein
VTSEGRGALLQASELPKTFTKFMRPRMDRRTWRNGRTSLRDLVSASSFSASPFSRPQSPLYATNFLSASFSPPFRTPSCLQLLSTCNSSAGPRCSLLNSLTGFSRNSNGQLVKEMFGVRYVNARLRPNKCVRLPSRRPRFFAAS